MGTFLEPNFSELSSFIVLEFWCVMSDLVSFVWKKVRNDFFTIIKSLFGVVSTLSKWHLQKSVSTSATVQ